MRSFPIPPSKLNPPTNTNTNTLAPTSSTVEMVTTTTSTSSSPIASPWHSPIPYLFGGLAIIMALISMALFILACSYWRLTRRTQQRDLENINNNINIKEGDDDPQKKEHPFVYEEKIFVIMAGDHKPTFLATPSSNTNFHKHLGNSENFDMSQMEISDNNHVVVVVSDENGSSHEHNEQHSQ